MDVTHIWIPQVMKVFITNTAVSVMPEPDTFLLEVNGTVTVATTCHMLTCIL